MPSDHTPRVVLHVGTEKTGSSHIQANLARNPRALAAAGARYATAGLESNHHYWLARAFAFSNPPVENTSREAGIRTAIRRECAGADAQALVISSEHFDIRLGQAKAQRLVDALGRPRIVLVLRNQIAFLQSLYLEHLKWSGVCTFAEFLRFPEVRRKADYDAKVGIWEATGADLHVIDYDSVSSGGLLTAFLAAAGLPADASGFSAGASRANVSPSIDFMEFVRLSNIPLARESRRANFLAISASEDPRLAALKTHRPWPIPPQFRTFLEELEAGNARVAARLGLDPATFLGEPLLPRFEALAEAAPPNIGALLDRLDLYEKPKDRLWSLPG